MLSGFLSSLKIIQVTAAELASHDHIAGGGELGLSSGRFSLLHKEGESDSHRFFFLHLMSRVSVAESQPSLHFKDEETEAQLMKEFWLELFFFLIWVRLFGSLSLNTSSFGAGEVT